MKKKTLITGVLLALGFIFLVSPSALAGDYDGVWWSPEVLGTSQFFMVRQVGGTIAAITFELGGDAPVTVFLGSLIGNTVQMSSRELTPTLDIDMTGTFTSPIEGTFVVNSCSPSSECESTLTGVTIPIHKAF